METEHSEAVPNKTNPDFTASLTELKTENSLLQKHVEQISAEMLECYPQLLSGESVQSDVNKNIDALKRTMALLKSSYQQIYTCRLSYAPDRRISNSRK